MKCAARILQIATASAAGLGLGSSNKPSPQLVLCGRLDFLAVNCSCARLLLLHLLLIRLSPRRILSFAAAFHRLSLSCFTVSVNKKLCSRYNFYQPVTHTNTITMKSVTIAAVAGALATTVAGTPATLIQERADVTSITVKGNGALSKKQNMTS